MTADDAVPADFDRFFDSTFPRMMARALMLAGNRHDAEDAVQDAYAEALRRWDRIGGYDAPDAWVYRVVQQRLWKAARRWRRSRSLDAMEVAAWRATTGNTEQAVEARMVLAALAELPDRQRTVLVLHCLHGLEQQEIADRLGMTANAVRQAIFKARRSLEKVLGMVRSGQVRTDGLTSGRPVFVDTKALPDRVASAVRAAESWLSTGIEENTRARERIRRAVQDRARGRSS